MTVSAAVVSCSELSLYGFKLSFIQLKCRISDHEVRAFPRQPVMQCIHRCAVQGTYACMNAFMYRLCIKPFHFISFHFISFQGINLTTKSTRRKLCNLTTKRPHSLIAYHHI